MKKLINNKKTFIIVVCVLMLSLVPNILLRQIYLINPSVMVPGSLSTTSIVFSVIAALSTLFYLLNTSHIHALPPTWIVLCSCAYGLSSYTFGQSYNWKVLVCFALFPLLFYYYEHSCDNDVYSIFFILLLTFTLVLSPQHALAIWSTLFFMTVLHVCTRKLDLSEGLKCSINLFFAFLLSAFRIFSYFTEQSVLGNLRYNGFHSSYSLFAWFSRLLTGSSTALALSPSNGFNIAFGIFFLLLCFVYIVSYNEFKKDYYSDIANLVFIAISLTFSPIRYIITFGQTNMETIDFSYIFVFLCLCMALKALSIINTLPVKRLFFACVAYLCFIAITLLFASHNFMQLTQYTIIFFSLGYVILIMFFCMSKGKFNLTLFASCLVITELILNAFICTNYNLIPESCDTSSHYDSVTSLLNNSDSNESVIETTHSASSAQVDYSNYVSKHRDLTLENVLSQLDRMSQLSGEKIDFEKDLLFPTAFEKANNICHHFGIEDNLFESYDFDISFTEDKQYSLNKIANEGSLFAIKRLHYDDDVSPETLVSYSITPRTPLPSSRVLVTCNLDGIITVYDTVGTHKIHSKILIPEQSVTCKNVVFSTYIINESLLEKLPSIINAYTSTLVSRITFMDYLGLFISCVMAMFFILCLMRRKLVFDVCTKTTVEIANKLKSSRLTYFICNNYMYIISFLLPFLIYICSLIIIDCKPFGVNSILDQDGLGLTLPSYMDAYYNLKKGNTYVSLNGGYGYSLFSTNPLIHLILFYKLLPATAIEPLILLSEGLCLGLCSLFMAYYLTHRRNRKPTFKKHPLLLFASCIYALNAYMLSMHGFTSWYFFYMLVPLVILSLDYLIYKKRLAPYIITLTLCMMINLYLALYLCLFLIIWFFTYHFTDFKDFLTKGIRFALCSILCAGNSIFVIASVYFGTSYSNYKDKDSIFPKPGLHTNYLNILKQQMLFAPSTAVTSDEGYVSSYFGIITLILLILFILQRGVKCSEKLRRLIPIAILYWCFNGKIMSYIWNGFHYQAKVPNRYAFLLMFIVAELAFDILSRFDFSKKIFTIIGSVLTCTLFVICKMYDKDITSVSFVFSIVFIAIYFFTILLLSQRKRCKQLIITSVLVIELFANTLYTTKRYSYTDVQAYGNYTEIAQTINNVLIEDDTFSRAQFPCYSVFNSALYNVGSASLFNSFVNLYQTNTNNLYGYLSAINFMICNHAGSLFGNMLSATEYIMYPFGSNDLNNDLIQYEFVGYTGAFYAFKNPRKISLGFYLPNDALNHQDKLDNVESLWNNMLCSYIGNKEVLHSKYIAYSTKPKSWNRFYFTDCCGNILSKEDVNNQLIDANINSTSSSYCYPSIQMHIDFIADADGFAYIAPNEYIALKEVKKGDYVSLDISYPNTAYFPTDTLHLVTEDISLLDTLHNQIAENQLENITVHDNMIEGTVDYEKDGYTFYSLAYDKSWHAYVDGKEVEVEDPYYSCLAVKTPAGKHTITLKYIPYGMWPSKFISLGFIILSFFICFLNTRKHFHSKRL